MQYKGQEVAVQATPPSTYIPCVMTNKQYGTLQALVTGAAAAFPGNTLAVGTIFYLSPLVDTTNGALLAAVTAVLGTRSTQIELPYYAFEWTNITGGSAAVSYVQEAWLTNPTGTNPVGVIAQMNLIDGNIAAKTGVMNFGTFVSAAVGSGNVVGAGISTIVNIFADDGGAALAAGSEYRSFRSRLLITHAQSGNNNSFEGGFGHLKYCAVADTCAPAFRAGWKGYCESISGSTLGDKTAGLLGLIDVPLGSTVGNNCIVSAVMASSYNLGGTHTGSGSGYVVAYDAQTPFTSGAFDALLHASVNSGTAGTSYGSIDAAKCIIVLWEAANGTVTKMKIPLYAV